MGIDDVAKSNLGILENIFHNAKVGIAVCNGKNNIVEMVNPTFATIYGYEPSELIGVSSSKLFSSECMVRLATLEDTQNELSFEAVHSKKDGTPVNVSIHITVLKDGDGVVQQRIANIIDITEQIQAKHQVEETQAKLTSIISAIPDMIWMKDTNGFYLACNDALEQFFGKKEDELIGKTDYDLFPKENADICKLSDNEALQSNKISITVESFLYPEDGKAGVLEIRKVPVLKDDGKIIGVLGIGRDITEQKQMESEILKQKDFQDTLLLGTAEAGIGIHVIENGRYIYTNDIEKAKKYGYDESIFGVKPNFLDTIHPDDRAKAFEMYTRRMAGEDVPNSYELGVLQTDGLRKEHSVSVVPIPHTNPIQTIVVTQDITERKRQEERLNKIKAKLAAVITAIPDLIWVKDINGVYLMCNPAFERFFGASCGEIVGKTDYDFIQKEQADFFCQKDKEALEAGKMCINEEEIVFTDNGQYALVETRKMPIYFHDKFMGVLGIGRDITERKQMELELKAREEAFSSLANNIPDNIARFDSNGCYLYINSTHEKTIGMKLCEIIGKHYTEIIPSHSTALNALEQILKREQDEITIIQEFTNKNGELETHEIKFLAEKDGKDKLVSILGIGRNITERKRMEAEILRNENRLNEAQKIAKLGSWELEFPEFKLHWSDEVYRIFELTSGDLEPSYEYFLSLIHPDDRALVESIYNQSVQIYTPYDVVHRLLMKDGRIKYVQERGTTLYDQDGNPLKSFGTVQDITERMRVEKELQLQSEQLFRSEKMVAIGEIIENIAHQWRQPLTVISAMTSGIFIKKELGTLNDEELISYTERILIQTEYLSKTIDDFRNFIKGEKEENIFSISSLFDKIFSIVDSSLKANYIKLITNIDATLEVRGYENELMQAFINIINNAKDALVENETIETKYIFIEAKSYDNQCEICIKDNGGGINPSVINRIFEAYFTTKHKSQGTGLGLAMTYKIITEVHKGTITASNKTYEYNGKEYTGASFTILFEKYYENNL